METEILQDVRDAFGKATGLKMEVVPEKLYEGHGLDAVVKILGKGVRLEFPVEIKANLTHAVLGIAGQQIKEGRKKTLLVTRCVTPQIADRLKELDIPFADAAGNIYINELPLFIFVKGNKPLGKHQVVPINRAFRPAGLKVIFALLCNPGLENATFREIAEYAQVALGTVGWVMQDLKRMNYLIDMKTKGRRLTDKKNLLARWVTAYPEQLRPKQEMGRYRAGDLKNIDLNDFPAYWGGETAANLLTKHLKPQMATIYALQPIGPFLLKNGLKKDPNGNIEILKIFWNFQFDREHPNLVHPILIYADLIATGDERDIETAKIIYERELFRFIGED